jgi:Immunoglobulin I-set domain
VPAGYPRIVENPSLKAVEKDRSTVMICSAIGNPDPTILWYKDYAPIDLTDPRLKVQPTGTDSMKIRVVFSLFLTSF